MCLGRASISCKQVMDEGLIVHHRERTTTFRSGGSNTQPKTPCVATPPANPSATHATPFPPRSNHITLVSYPVTHPSDVPVSCPTKSNAKHRTSPRLIHSSAPTAGTARLHRFFLKKRELRDNAGRPSGELARIKVTIISRLPSPSPRDDCDCMHSTQNTNTNLA